MLHSSRRWWLWKSRLWVGIGGSEKNRLWCVANEMSGKQRYSKCSKLPPTARIHASSLYCHWSTVSSTMLCWNSAHVATRRCRSTTCPYSELVLDTREQMKKMKNLCNFYKVVGRHFSGVVGKEVTVCFFWDNATNRKYEWIILLKNDFLDFPRSSGYSI